MAGTLLDTITKRKFNFGPADPGGKRMVLMSGAITLRNAVANLTGGVTTVGSPIITGLTTTSNWRVGDYVTVDKGLPVAPACYKILAVAATTLTLDTDAVTSETAVTVVQAAIQKIDLSSDIPTLEGIVLSPSGGYVFDYTYTTKKFIVYGAWATHADEKPLEPITTKDIGALVVQYLAWGY